MVFLVIFLVLVIAALCVLIVLLSRRNSYYKLALGNMAGFVIMQRMFELMASAIPASKKIEELNNIILEVFNSKSSTISIYDGIEYNIKATNVEPTFRDSIKSLAEEPNFKANAQKNISKYLVSAGGRLLGYKSAVERGIRSAMFSPIYYNGMYLGFWLLEDNAENAYDSISKEELAKLKDHIGVFIENVLSQESIEGAYNTDKQTGFYNNLYLYSNVRQRTTAENNSVLTLMQLSNLGEINAAYGREVGNRLLERAATLMKDIFSNSHIFIRYSGSKFCIVSLGLGAETLHPTVERYISNIKMEEEIARGEKVSLNINVVMHNIQQQSNIDRELSKMSNYLDGMAETESNTIKII